MSTTPNSSEIADKTVVAKYPFTQNRELSWLTFDQRCLDQGMDESVPLLERLNFISIFWSNLQEFFMVRVGSLTDLSLVKKTIIDKKSGMTPSQQLDAIYARCHELYPQQERVFNHVTEALSGEGITYVKAKDVNEDQREFLHTYVQANVLPLLSPQIVNSRHPFPHLENGAIYVLVRLDETASVNSNEGDKKKKKKGGAEGVTLGLIPLPRQCKRVISLPGEGFTYTLLEEAIELFAAEAFNMYKVKHTNIICVTRNADLDTAEGADEADDDYREHMKRILKKRGRLAPVRLECARPLSENVYKWLLPKLELKDHQVYVTSVPLDLSYTWGLASHASEDKRAILCNPPFNPVWPSQFDRRKSILKQITKKEVLLCYPYESMDPFVELLREASVDPSVISINITLYRLATISRLAEALIAAAENGKRVTALFELRARFDESNNIEWSQQFEDAGCNVIYGFRDFKVHSKICCITRQTEDGLQYITQLGTGNYNEKTAKLYTDFSFFTTDPEIGKDATEFFRNMALENASDEYNQLWVAPLQIKPNILAGIDAEIEKARQGKPCGLLFKTNSITDDDIIEKIAEASQAGVPTTLFVRGISCIVPGIEGFTDNVRVVSIVGRLLEHSRVYAFGDRNSDDFRMYLSSADLMTRNMDKRVEIAWPVKDADLRQRALEYLEASLRDTAKLRELNSDGTYTVPAALADPAIERFESQDYHIQLSRKKAEAALAALEAKHAAKAKAKAEKKIAAEGERLAGIFKEAAENATASEPASPAIEEPEPTTEPACQPESVEPVITQAVQEKAPEPKAAPLQTAKEAPKAKVPTPKPSSKAAPAAPATKNSRNGLLKTIGRLFKR